MVTALREEILDHIASYLRGKESLADFEDWHAMHSWDAHKTEPQEVVDLIGAIDLRLAERSSGYWSDEELKQQLQDIVIEFTPMVLTNAVLSYGSSAVTVFTGFEGFVATELQGSPSQTVDTECLVVSA